VRKGEIDETRKIEKVKQAKEKVRDNEETRKNEKVKEGCKKVTD